MTTIIQTLEAKPSMGFLLMLAITLASCESENEPACVGEGCVTQSCDDFDPLRRPLFGDTHVHTTLSQDANVGGTRLGPEGAYRYAKGEPIGAPPFDADGNPAFTIQRDRSLDFVVVSDHAEFLGTVPLCTDPDEPAYAHPLCETYRGDPFGSFATFGLFHATDPSESEYPALCGDNATECIEAGERVWQDSIDAANVATDPTSACTFSALIGYEWTTQPSGNNLHRNIVFRNETVPDRAIGFFDEPYVEGLWESLRAECIDADTGCNALTIPHNPNLSGGLMFEQSGRDGPFDASYAQERQFMEPLIEIYQHKGESECPPGETATDEFCGFEKVPFNRLIEQLLFTDPDPRSFVRSAYGEGMKLEQALGANPFKFGVVAATDTHISAPGSTSELGYSGHTKLRPGVSLDSLLPGLFDNPYNSPGGLSVVWAEENSREAIFDAMRRRETYGTSGTHIVARFFGGWSYPSDLCDDTAFAQVGYDNGVPMGGDLPERPSDADAPTFALSALQDPGAGSIAGTPLQRIQIVKGWLDDSDEYQTQVFEVGGDPDNGASVDLSTCDTNEGSGGFSNLCSVWTDPAFDPDRPAYYYARVIENPTCRWSQRQCNEAGVDCSVPETITEGFETCCDLTDEECAAASDEFDCDVEPIAAEFESCCRPRVPKTIQERAWTSPIWYTP